MRNLLEVLESVIETYYNNEFLNYMDIRDLDSLMNSNRDLVNTLINSYNEKERIDCIQIFELEQIVMMEEAKCSLDTFRENNSIFA